MAGRQQGLGLMALIFVLALLVVVALFAMKVIPSYLEYRAAKTAIDDINALKSTDLEITKDGNAVVISFAYRKEVQLFPNVGLYIDYNARAGGQ